MSPETEAIVVFCLLFGGGLVGYFYIWYKLLTLNRKDKKDDRH